MSCCATTALVSSHPTSTDFNGMPLVRLVVPGGAGVPPPGHLLGVFLLGGHFFQGASEKVMLLESAQLSVCSPMVLYSTAGVRGGCVAGLRAKGAPRLGL